MGKTSQKTKPPGPEPVGYFASVTLRNGRVIYARDYGLKGFPIRSGSLRRSLKKLQR